MPRSRDQLPEDPTPKVRAVALKNWIHRATDTAEGFATAFSILHEHGLQPIGAGTTRKLEGEKELLYLTIHFCCDDATFRAVFNDLQRRVHSSIGIQEVDLHEVMGHLSADVTGISPEEHKTLRRKPYETNIVDRVIVTCSERTLTHIRRALIQSHAAIARIIPMEGEPEHGQLRRKIKVSNMNGRQQESMAKLLQHEGGSWCLDEKATLNKNGNLVTIDRLNAYLREKFVGRILRIDMGPPGTIIRTDRK